jgi:hypothetical protein
MLFKEIIGIYCDNHTKSINTPCGQNAKLSVNIAGGTYSYNWSLKYQISAKLSVHNFFQVAYRSKCGIAYCENSVEQFRGVTCANVACCTQGTLVTLHAYLTPEHVGRPQYGVAAC